MAEETFAAGSGTVACWTTNNYICFRSGGKASGGASMDMRGDAAASFMAEAGASWWDEWEPTAAEQRQHAPPRKRRAWQPPADSDAQLLAKLTTEVRGDHQIIKPRRTNGAL